MTTLERQKIAEEQGIISNLGRKVKGRSSCAFRSGDTAEIVGWGLNPEDDRLVYFIKYENAESDIIPTGELFDESGYIFVE